VVANVLSAMTLDGASLPVTSFESPPTCSRVEGVVTTGSVEENQVFSLVELLYISQHCCSIISLLDVLYWKNSGLIAMLHQKLAKSSFQVVGLAW
jgi:hypothetical protein